MRIRYTFDADGQRIDARRTPLADALEGTERVVVESTDGAVVQYAV